MEIKKFLSYLGLGFEFFKLCYRNEIGLVISKPYTRFQLQESKDYDNFEVVSLGADLDSDMTYILYLKNI